MKKLRLLNSTVYNDKQYSVTDGKGFEPLEKHGIPTGFYGGRVDKLAKTDVKGLYMCMEDMAVIDLLEIPFSEEPKSLKEMTNKELVALLEGKGIEVPKKYTKPELLALLEG